MNVPLLSILIVNWNTRELLRDCLNSIYEDPQSIAWEVVVVDNGSGDHSAALVESSFPQARLLALGQNLGFVGGYNLALEKSRGQYLLLLNSDTRVEPGALGGLVAFLEDHPQAGAVGPRLVHGDGTVQLSCGLSPSLGAEIVNKLLLHKVFPFFKFGRWNHAQIREVGWVTGACLLVRRAAIQEVGPLDPAIFMFYEDVEWCLRMRRAGWKVFYYPFSRVVHLGGQSTRKNFDQMLVISQQSQFYLFQKHFGRGALHLLRALTLVEMVFRSLAWSCFSWGKRRVQARQRLKAYREIFSRTLCERAYWAPAATEKN
jgi:GT2 family glycosyltransferase